MTPRFASVVLDVDSTLTGIEGIDWLAARRGPEIAAGVAELTARAMAGDYPLEEVYAGRLDAVRPTEADIAALGRAYVAAMAPGAGKAIAAMRAAGVEIEVVSGGLLNAIFPLAAALDIPSYCVNAVLIGFDDQGRYTGVGTDQELTTQHGKAEIVRGLSVGRPLLAVGDGSTDAAMRPVVDAFAAYTGFVRRESVVRVADFEIASFDELAALVLG